MLKRSENPKRGFPYHGGSQGELGCMSKGNVTCPLRAKWHIRPPLIFVISNVSQERLINPMPIPQDPKEVGCLICRGFPSLRRL